MEKKIVIGAKNQEKSGFVFDNKTTMKIEKLIDISKIHLFLNFLNTKNNPLGFYLLIILTNEKENLTFTFTQYIKNDINEYTIDLANVIKGNILYKDIFFNPSLIIFETILEIPIEFITKYSLD